MEQLSEERRQQLDDFFKQQQTRAFKMAYVMTQNREDALELVQDSMLRLVRSYASKPSREWRMLFYRILQNCIRDFHRRQGIRKLFGVFSLSSQPFEDEPETQVQDTQQHDPQQRLEQTGELAQIITALKTLPLRQQQVFLLRAWQEFSVSESADILSISPGSVKTHYSRAQNSLRDILGDSYE